ncbi:MAG: hypothetical protein ACKO20_00215, partial [Actinomycetota bacterium]
VVFNLFRNANVHVFMLPEKSESQILGCSSERILAKLSGDQPREKTWQKSPNIAYSGSSA